MAATVKRTTETTSGGQGIVGVGAEDGAEGLVGDEDGNENGRVGEGGQKSLKLMAPKQCWGAQPQPHPQSQPQSDGTVEQSDAQASAHAEADAGAAAQH